MPERKLAPSEAQWTVQAIARGILTLGAILGVLIILGGRARWSGPSYEIALTYPYAPESWGYIIGVISIVGLVGSLLGRFRIVAGACFTFSAWCVFFAMSFWQTAAHNPNAGTLGVPIYLAGAILAALIGTVHWRSRDALHR